jgi:hypothetical protein
LALAGFTAIGADLIFAAVVTGAAFLEAAFAADLEPPF